MLCARSSAATGVVLGSLDAVGGALTTGTSGGGTAVRRSTRRGTSGFCKRRPRICIWRRRKRCVRNSPPPANNKPVAATSAKTTSVEVELSTRADVCAVARPLSPVGCDLLCVSGDGRRKAMVGMLRGTRSRAAAASAGAAACGAVAPPPGNTASASSVCDEAIFGWAGACCSCGWAFACCSCGTPPLLSAAT